MHINPYTAQKLLISAFRRYMGRHASEFICSFDFPSSAQNRIFWSESRRKSPYVGIPELPVLYYLGTHPAGTIPIEFVHADTTSHRQT
eukprot:COSAG02_NODE_926_length_15856_cov_13.975566_14_plen_88_part_00